MVADLMQTRLPNAHYTVTTDVDNGTPVAYLTFPDRVTADYAVLQLSLQLDASPSTARQSARPKPSLPANSAGPSAPETAVNRAIHQTALAAGAAASPGSSTVAAKMTGFPAAASSSSMLSIVADIMQTRLPNAHYDATTDVDNGTPVATLMFPNRVTADYAVLQLNGKQHGNMQLSLQLDASPSTARQSATPSAGPPTLQNHPGSGAHPAPAPPPPSKGQARSPSRAPSFGNQGGSVTARVQASNNRPELIKLIHKHLTGRAGAPLKELEDLKIRLRNMRVRLLLLPCKVCNTHQAMRFCVGFSQSAGQTTAQPFIMYKHIWPAKLPGQLTLCNACRFCTTQQRLCHQEKLYCMGVECTVLG